MVIIDSMPEAEYHAHPALSSTGARLILDAPAKFHWAQTHPQPFKKQFDLGTAVHSKVLGTGYGIAVIPEDITAVNGALSTKEAKAFVAEARSKNLIPIKEETAEQVDAMAESILAHPQARALFEQEGTAEASVFATDPETGVDLRARFDFLPSFLQPNPRCVDLKTTAKSASAEEFAKTVANFGYDVQEAHYLHTYGVAIGDFSAQLEFVVIETFAPYLVAVHSLSIEFGEIGSARAKRARQLFRECTDSGVWPGYEEDPLPLQPPMWHIYQNEDLLQ